MQKKLLDFAQKLHLQLSSNALILLEQYANLVWDKKESLNLTSVANREEIFTRHICDGLAGASWAMSQLGNRAGGTLADAGSGAGYIGLTIAIVLPQVQVHLIESLQRRCMFLQWVVMKLGLKNVVVENMRLGQQTTSQFDLVTERAMGQIMDILPLLSAAVKPGGQIGAYQSTLDVVAKPQLEPLGLAALEPVKYTLPGEQKERYIAVFNK